MLTYFKGRYNRYGPPDDQGYTLNEYFTYRLDADHILLTTRHRAWVILNPQEYEFFLRHRVEERPELYTLLEDLGLILTPRNGKDIATIHCQRYAFLHRPPSLFIMVPTNRCNMACVYCHAQARVASSVKWDMSDEVLYKTVDFFFSVPRGGRKEMRIEFQGGESLLRYDLIQRAMDYAMERAEAEGLETRFAIVSNLTLMTGEIAQDVKKRGNVRLTSSLDGPPVVHDKQRVYPGGKGTYADVVRWAEKLKEEYEIKVPFLPTFTVNGLGHERELVDEYITRGVNSIYLRYVNRTGRAYEGGYDIGVTSEQFIEAWKTTLTYVLEKNQDGQRFVEHQTAYLLGNILNPSHAYMCLRRPCGCGISQVAVGHDGAIHGCDGGRSVPMLIMGNVLTDTYDEVFTSDTAIALRTIASETLPECQTCPFGPYCGYCVARGINQHSNPIPDVPLDFECQIYREMIPHLFRKLLNREEAAILNSWV
jgi:radical SAM protein with 4Fe4S-binding SPASM domain